MRFAIGSWPTSGWSSWTSSTSTPIPTVVGPGRCRCCCCRRRSSCSCRRRWASRVRSRRTWPVAPAGRRSRSPARKDLCRCSSRGSSRPCTRPSSCFYALSGHRCMSCRSPRPLPSSRPRPSRASSSSALPARPRSRTPSAGSGSARGSGRRCVGWCCTVSGCTTPGCCRSTAGSWRPWRRPGCWP